MPQTLGGWAVLFVQVEVRHVRLYPCQGLGSHPFPKRGAGYFVITHWNRSRSILLILKPHMMDDLTINRRVKHRIQVASQRGSGTASLVVPTENCLEMDDDATIMIQAACCRLGLATPRLAHANEMPAELHSNGTTCSDDSLHGEREYHDWSTLPRLPELWHLRQAQPTYASGSRLPQERAEIHRLNQLSRQQLLVCGSFCGRQEQAHRRTGLGEPLLAETTGH